MSGAKLFVHRRPAVTRSAGTILWVHGYTLDGALWVPLWDLLPEFDHIAPDLPGHGRSPGLDGSETRAGIADRLLEVVEAEGVRHLVGLSFGGMLALEAAIRAPGRFDAVVLASPGLAGGPQDPEAATCNQDLIRLAAERGTGSWLAQRWMSVPPSIFSGLTTRPCLRTALTKVIARHRWDELRLPVMRDLMAWSQSETEIARIEADILLLVGAHDIPAFLRCAEIIRRSARRARRVSVPEAAHLCLLEEPEAAAELIRTHLLQPTSSNAND